MKQLLFIFLTINFLLASEKATPSDSVLNILPREAAPSTHTLWHRVKPALQKHLAKIDSTPEAEDAKKRLKIAFGCCVGDKIYGKSLNQEILQLAESMKKAGFIYTSLRWQFTPNTRSDDVSDKPLAFIFLSECAEEAFDGSKIQGSKKNESSEDFLTRKCGKVYKISVPFELDILLRY